MPYWNDVLTSLRKVIRATDVHSKRMVKSAGLTIPQVATLRAISLLGDVTIKSVSKEVSLSQATVTTILNRLQEKALVERVRCSKDKRVVYVRLTEQGQEVLASAPPLLDEGFIKQFDALEDWEKHQIVSVLQRVATMMDKGESQASAETSTRF